MSDAELLEKALGIITNVSGFPMVFDTNLAPYVWIVTPTDQPGTVLVRQITRVQVDTTG